MARTTPVNSGYTIINGAGTGTNGDRIDVWVEYKAEDQSISGNYTTLIAYFYAALKSDQASSTALDYGLAATFTVDGQAGSGWTSIGYNFTEPSVPCVTSTAVDDDGITKNYLGKFKGNIVHGDDGTRSVTIKGSFSTQSSYISGGNIAVTVTLPTIPRASDVSATNANIGSTSTIAIGRKATSFTHTLTYAFGELTGTIAENTSDTSIAWTVPEAFYDEIPNDKSGVCTITCETYNGTTLIGSSTCKFTATASESVCAPDFAWWYATDKNLATRALTGNMDVLVRYHSTVQASAMAWARKGSTMASITVTNGNNKATVTGYEESASVTDTYSDVSMDVVGVENPKFVFTATDSRGYSSTETVEATMVNYVNLTCVLTKVKTTADGDISFTVSGSYFNGTFGEVTNSLNVYYRYKAKGGTYCDNIEIADVTISDNTYTATFSISGLDYKTTYIYEACAVDALMTVNSAAKTIKFEPVFDWGESDFQFNVPVGMPKNQYFKTEGIPGINMNNSDIANANGIYFKDASDTNGEGLNFYKSDGVYDRLYVLDGKVLVALDEVCGSGEAVGTRYIVFSPAKKPYYEAGDSVTINTVYAGIVTGSAKNFYLFIPLSKPVLSSKVSISGTLTGRGINGYVLDSYNNPVDLTKTVDPVTTTTIIENGIRVLMSYEAAQETGVTNNTPINWYGSVTLTFSD